MTVSFSLTILYDQNIVSSNMGLAPRVSKAKANLD